MEVPEEGLERNREERLLAEAVEQGVSDIHFEPKQQGMLVRFRKDDVLFEKGRIPREEQEQLVTRLKVKCGMNIAERRGIQKGRFLFQTGSNRGEVMVRASVMPTVYGEKLALRLLEKRKLDSNLESLGFSDETAARLRKIIQYPSGLFLFTGPTGSGKTTTQMALIRMMNNQEKNILIIEEPMEYYLEEANQIEVNQERGMDYEYLLRESLRQDPDLLVIGEVRDSKTAQTAFRAAGTGHLVFATMHTETGMDALQRLMDFGLSELQILTVLKGIVCQRLLRALCETCKVKEEIHLGKVVYQKAGCEECLDLGYRGRFAAGHVRFIDEKVRKELQQDFFKAYFLFLEEDQWKLKDEVLKNVFSGKTSLEEAERKIIMTEGFL